MKVTYLLNSRPCFKNHIDTEICVVLNAYRLLDIIKIVYQNINDLQISRYYI